MGGDGFPEVGQAIDASLCSGGCWGSDDHLIIVEIYEPQFLSVVVVDTFLGSLLEAWSA